MTSETNLTQRVALIWFLSACKVWLIVLCPSSLRPRIASTSLSVCDPGPCDVYFVLLIHLVVLWMRKANILFKKR